MKSKSLQDLDAMRKKLADIAEAQALAEQARIAEAKRTEAERNLFTRKAFNAMRKVAKLFMGLHFLKRLIYYSHHQDYCSHH
jgi:hypothetical protein